MRKYNKKLNTPEAKKTNICCLGKEIPKKNVKNREGWAKYYAERMFRLWSQCQTCLGVSKDYVDQIKERLADFHDDPLKKMFIENTY